MEQQEELPQLGYRIYQPELGVVRVGFTEPVIPPQLQGYLRDGAEFVFDDNKELPSADAERFAFCLALMQAIASRHRKFCLLSVMGASAYELLLTHGIAMASEAVKSGLTRLIEQSWNGELYQA